jgi:hypothetical protein
MIHTKACDAWCDSTQVQLPSPARAFCHPRASSWAWRATMWTRCKMRCCWTSSRRCVTPAWWNTPPVLSPDAPPCVPAQLAGHAGLCHRAGPHRRGEHGCQPRRVTARWQPLCRGALIPPQHRRPRPEGAHDAARDEVRPYGSPVLRCFPHVGALTGGPAPLLVVVPCPPPSPLRLHHAGPSGAEVAAAAREVLLQHSLKRAAQAVRIASPQARCDPPAPLCLGLTRSPCALRRQEDPDAMYLDKSGPTPPHKKKVRAHSACDL